MKLEEMSMAELMALHNALAEKAAGPKTFASRSKIVARIRQIASDRNIDLDAFKQSRQAKVTKAETGPADTAAESPEATPEKSRKRGNGVGELARRLLLEPEGFPHAVIAEMVNAQLPGAVATHNSVRWYASKMRKEGIEVPERRPIRDDYIWITDPKAAEEWLRGVRVVKPGTTE